MAAVVVFLAVGALATAPVQPNPVAAVAGELGLGPIRFCMQEEQLLAIRPWIRNGQTQYVGQLTAGGESNTFLLRDVTHLAPGCLFNAKLVGDRDGLSDVRLRLKSGDARRCSLLLRKRWTELLGQPRIQKNQAPSVPSNYYTWQQGSYAVTVWDFYGWPRRPWLDIDVSDSWRSPLVIHDGPTLSPNPCLAESRP
jgi:hypothetical protein